MMETMVQRNEGKPAVRPDIATFNGLVRAAKDKKDNLLAERFVQMALDMGLTPDFHTYSLQLDYRIDANDSSGALSSFDNLQSNVPRNVDELPVVNKYVRSLCSTDRVDMERLLEVVATVEQLQISMEPATVVALCKLFLHHAQQ